MVNYYNNFFYTRNNEQDISLVKFTFATGSLCLVALSLRLKIIHYYCYISFMCIHWIFLYVQIVNVCVFFLFYVF